MTTDQTAAPPAGEQGNHQAAPDAPRPATRAAAAEQPEPEEPCEPCAGTSRAQSGLGLVICAVAGGLAYIGLDLLTGGAVSRAFGARPWTGPEAEDDGDDG